MPELPSLPAITSEPISVVLLVHNAEAHLEEVVGSWVGFLNGLNREYEVVLVDDGSTDRTAELAEPLVQRNPRVRLLRHETHRGEGAALRTGVAAAQLPLLACAPCDRRYRPDELRRLLGEIDRAHVVSGYRVWQPVPGWARGLGQAYRAAARILFALTPEVLPGWLGWRTHLHQVVARVLFAIRLKDVGCRFRLFRRSVFERIPIQSDSRFAHTEVLAKANFLGCIMTETPISYRPPATPDDEPWKRSLAEGYRVFCQPEFGPPTPPASEKAVQPA